MTATIRTCRVCGEALGRRELQEHWRCRKSNAATEPVTAPAKRLPLTDMDLQLARAIVTEAMVALGRLGANTIAGPFRATWESCRDFLGESAIAAKERGT